MGMLDATARFVILNGDITGDDALTFKDLQSCSLADVRAAIDTIDPDTDTVSKFSGFVQDPDNPRCYTITHTTCDKAGNELSSTTSKITLTEDTSIPDTTVTLTGAVGSVVNADGDAFFTVEDSSGASVTGVISCVQPTLQVCDRDTGAIRNAMKNELLALRGEYDPVLFAFPRGGTVIHPAGALDVETNFTLLTQETVGTITNPYSCMSLKIMPELGSRQRIVVDGNTTEEISFPYQTRMQMLINGSIIDRYEDQIIDENGSHTSSTNIHQTRTNVEVLAPGQTATVTRELYWKNENEEPAQAVYENMIGGMLWGFPCTP